MIEVDISIDPHLGMSQIEQLNLIAKRRGGECLSVIYTGSRHKLTWKCSFNHQWEAMPANVKFGSWCPFCAKNIKSSLTDMQEIAAAKGGKMISDIYVNSGSRLIWECKLGHRWEAKPRDVKNGHWCPKCYGNIKKSYLELQMLAAANDGCIISSESVYQNNKSKLKWKCKIGHIWLANANSIGNGTWCPSCNESRKSNIFKTEELCRDVFEKIFSLSFKRSRPHWLMGPKNYPLELDGLNEDLGLAFEYNGLQHYQKVDFFKVNEDRLKYQKEKQELKLTKCKERGIKLIVIPFVKNPSKQKIEKIVTLLLEEYDLI